MPEVGLEPTLCCHNGILNPARLPIPPLRRLVRLETHGHAERLPQVMGRTILYPRVLDKSCKRPCG